MITQNSQNSHIFFYCEKCDYECCRKSDYNKHILTSKHQNDDAQLPKTLKTLKTLKKYNCSCGKEYRYRQGLYLHRKKCTKYENIEEPENIAILENTDKKDELINYLIKENQEFKNLILEIVKKDTITNNNITSNSHNKTFNLNVFLNETCKDAMNIMDFVDSLKLQLSDLENVGKIGFVEGISNIIVKNLNSLDETQRPIHCTDAKREVMYVKDADKWEKENEEKKKLRKAIKQIAHKNSKLLNEFKTKHPDCGKSESRFSDQYNKLVIEAMGGKGDNDLEKEDKIIKNIAKEVIINKNI
jgi:hypothetical protein